MKSRLSLAVVGLALLHTASAWMFVWRDKSGSSSLEWGNGSKDCYDIKHAEGKHFSWDPKEEGVCILMYSDDKCTSNVIGRSCPIWAKDSSTDISAFRVVDSDFTKSQETQSSTTTEEPTTSTTSASMTTTTSDATTTNPSEPGSTAGSTSEATAVPSQGNGGLSGGAIAGVVIGVIAAIALGILIGWILFRRHQRNSNRPKSLGPSAFAGATPAVKISSIPPEPPGPPKSSGGGSHYGPESPSALKWGSPGSPTDYEPPPAPYTTRPPPGTHMAELSDTNQLVELDASPRP